MARNLVVIGVINRKRCKSSKEKIQMSELCRFIAKIHNLFLIALLNAYWSCSVMSIPFVNVTREEGYL